MIASSLSCAQHGQDEGKLRMALAAFLGQSTHGWADVVGRDAIEELAAAAEAAEGAEQVPHLTACVTDCRTTLQHGKCSRHASKQASKQASKAAGRQASMLAALKIRVLLALVWPQAGGAIECCIAVAVHPCMVRGTHAGVLPALCAAANEHHPG